MAQAQRMLIVALEALPAEVVRRSVRRLGQGEGTDIRIVSPASELSRLQWLANEEDEAREHAEKVAEHAAAAVGAGPTHVESEAGDVDRLQAAEDALRELPADEIVVLCTAGNRGTWLERASFEEGFERFGVPVEYVAVA